MFKAPEIVLRSALVADARVASLVGPRIYPILAPASAALPLITWRRTSINREQTLARPMGVPKVTVDFAIYGESYEQARELADAVRSVLDGYGGTVENTEVNQASLENEADDFVTLSGADMPTVYQITQTYDVMWQET